MQRFDMFLHLYIIRKSKTKINMNTNILNITAFLMILAGSLLSCNKQGEENISRIDSKINIRMVETITASPRTLQFYCVTTRNYPCYNYPIYVESLQSSNIIDISFKGVIENDLCFTAIGPATAVIDLGALSNGKYRLNLSNGKVKRSGELIVSSDGYTVNFGKNSGISFSNTPLYKIPEHTIWGIIGYHNKETSPLVQKFLNELMNLDAKKTKYTPGYYNDFVIDKNGEITYPGVLWGYWFDQPFIFTYSGNIANIEQLIKQFAHNHKEQMNIMLNTDKGEKFMSWMY